jgi:hypothetical protein
VNLGGEPYKSDVRELPLPPLPPEGYTYAIDGATGKRAKKVPAGKCGRSCRECWPFGSDE